MSLIDAINLTAPVSKLLFFLVNVVGLELIIWMYAFNRYSRPNKLFLLITLYLLVWVNADFSSDMASMFLPDESVVSGTLWSLRIVFALTGIFWAGFYYLAMNLPIPPLPNKNRLKETVHAAFWLVFSAACFSPLIIQGVDFGLQLPLTYSVRPGMLFWPFAVVGFFSFVLSASTIRKKWHLVDQDTQKRLHLVIIGAGIFGAFNLVCNIIFSVFGGIYEYGRSLTIFLDYALITFLGYAAYCYVREKLFGLKVIFVEIFAGLMGASLAVMPFFVDLFWQQALFGVLFLLFCVFGYILVKSTIKEYHEKELLEIAVLERTRELERAKLNLEEMNSALEIRVKARTMELEKLNQTLEQKVVERTNALEAKIKDLETFQRLTVGRELKMIELKKENERLRVVTTASEERGKVLDGDSLGRPSGDKNVAT